MEPGAIQRAGSDPGCPQVKAIFWSPASAEEPYHATKCTLGSNSLLAAFLVMSRLVKSIRDWANSGRWDSASVIMCCTGTTGSVAGNDTLSSGTTRALDYSG